MIVNSVKALIADVWDKSIVDPDPDKYTLVLQINKLWNITAQCSYIQYKKMLNNMQAPFKMTADQLLWFCIGGLVLEFIYSADSISVKYY